MNNLLKLAQKLDDGYAQMYAHKAADALRKAGTLLSRIRAAINTNGELSVPCMLDIDEILQEEEAEK